MKQACHKVQDYTFSVLCRNHYKQLWVVCTLRRYIRCAVKNEEIAEYIKQEFFTHLKPHLIEEEMYLFPQLPPNDALRLHAEEQHANLRQLAEKRILFAKTSLRIIEEFANVLEENIRFEERIFFPYLQKMGNFCKHRAA